VEKRTWTPNERILKLVDAAMDLQQAGEGERALEILLQAYEQAPEYAPIPLLIGLAHRDAGRPEEAEASLRRAIELDPEQPEALQSLGLLLASRGRSSEAIKLLKRHAELQPDDAVTLKALGAELARLGRGEEAVHLLEDAWRKSRTTDVGITYGRYLIRVQQPELAQQVLRQVAEAAPEPKPLVEWAYALVLLERHEEALSVLQRILQMDPGFDRAWRGMSGCYLALGERTRAFETAEQALAIDEGHYRNWLAKANALLSLGRYPEMLEAAQRGIACVPPGDAEATPVFQELRLRQVEALLHLDRADEALVQLDELRHQFPTEERLTRDQVLVLNRLGRTEDALRVLDEAREAGMPADGGLAPLRYETLHLAGKRDEAWKFIRPMLETQTETRLHFLGDVGLLFYVRGQVEAARAVLEQLHSFAPDETRFACNLAFILTGEGELADAERYLLRALEVPDSAEMRPLVTANLGYLYLVQGDYPKADLHLRQAVLLTTGGEAILRVARWQEDQVIPDYTPHPTRFLPIRVAAHANLVTLALAQGRVEEAADLARKMLEEAPDASLGYEMLGWVLYAEGKFDETRQAWEEGTERAGDPEERRALAQWLKSLPE
jgi:tetratricopeptide (TPR) repeat protein